jgi:hypothetical protein
MFINNTLISGKLERIKAEIDLLASFKWVLTDSMDIPSLLAISL